MIYVIVDTFISTKYQKIIFFDQLIIDPYLSIQEIIGVDRCRIKFFYILPRIKIQFFDLNSLGFKIDGPFVGKVGESLYSIFLFTLKFICLIIPICCIFFQCF